MKVKVKLQQRFFSRFYFCFEYYPMSVQENGFYVLSCFINLRMFGTNIHQFILVKIYIATDDSVEWDSTIQNTKIVLKCDKIETEEVHKKKLFNPSVYFERNGFTIFIKLKENKNFSYYLIKYCGALFMRLQKNCSKNNENFSLTP